MELQEQLRDSKDAVMEAHNQATGLEERCKRLEAQVASLQQQLLEAAR